MAGPIAVPKFGTGGTIYEVTADGTESVLFSFGHTAAIGAGPTTGLIMDGKGNLYGTTESVRRYGVPSAPEAREPSRYAQAAR